MLRLFLPFAAILSATAALAGCSTHDLGSSPRQDAGPPEELDSGHDAAGMIYGRPMYDAGIAVCDDGGRTAVSQVDLLFMIDNSASMADKQQILAEAVPDLVNRLVDPPCIDPATLAVVGKRDARGVCAVGEPDFPAVSDIHIGIVSSSLGGHGAAGVCDDQVDIGRGRTDPHNDDKGHLITRGATAGVAAGFLSWNPMGGGATTPDEINAPFQSMVAGVGQHGCGYESQLESIYRFLIDPQPFESIGPSADLAPGVIATDPSGSILLDKALLKQRADFLRPDSLVGVIAITDENDCSIVDGGQFYYAILPPSGTPPHSLLAHGTSKCLENPNDNCCFSCLQNPRPGCMAPADDPECKKGQWLQSEDPTNLRCFNQKQRYGVDFLYPVQRYVDGFTLSTIHDRDNKPVKNPLFDDLSAACTDSKMCGAERDKGLVFLAGIVGVPWQDIARRGKSGDPDIKLGYMSPRELVDNQVWSKILGDPARPSGPVLPTDMHMVESVSPRAGLPPPGSAPNADPINGHEWDPSKLTRSPNSDLQYACVFDLPVPPGGMPKTCAGTDCDCAPEDVTNGINDPLCTGVSTQIRAKAYPGLRELQVLQGLGDQGIVASVCPSNVTDTTQPDYGYRPAIAAIISRLRNQLRNCTVVN